MADLTRVDLVVFALYFVVLVALGFYVGRKQPATSEDYFLAGRRLPWYVIGTSFIGSNISTEHFIGMVGAAYVYGVCVAQWEWGNIFAFSVLVWVFIPFLLATRVFTAPEFLERRFSPGCRSLFAVMTVVANITAFLAAVLYAGAIGLNKMFGWDIWLGVVLLGTVAGSYAIFGGLQSVAWTDVFQTVVMVVGGVLISVLGLMALGEGAGIAAGWQTLLEHNRGSPAEFAEGIRRLAPEVLGEGATSYDRLAIFQPISHTLVPWITIFVTWLSISIWYNCINQFMIQRVLAAKDNWHARMGIILAGFMKIGLPVITVLPGLIYFSIDPSLTKTEADQSYPTLLMSLVHVGVRGLLLAALFGAIQSTVDSVLNSTATIITLDIYKRWLKPDMEERESVGVGRLVATGVLLLSMAMAPFIERLGQGVFVYIQNLYAYFAPPFSAVFVVGILWRRATARAAFWTVPFGMVFALFVEKVVFVYVWPEASAFTLRASITWFFCVLFMVLMSFVDPPPPPEKVTDEVTINWRRLNVFADLGRAWYQSVLFWWLLFALGVIACYVAFSGFVLR
jgi:SSS family solute:Na+ symporter